MNKVRELAVRVKNYFETKYNAQANLTQNADNEFEVEFVEPVELTEKEYDEEFYVFLRRLGFISSDLWEDNVVNTVKYKSYSGAEQYQSPNEQVIVYYDKVVENGETRYLIKGVIIEGASGEGS